MYLRFLRLQVRPGDEAAFTRFYQERVLPALAATRGCLYAALLAPWRSEAHQSLTIWASAEDAAAYSDGATYTALLAEAAPMLADRAEWRVRLSRDPEETIDPSRREPVREEFEVATAAGTAGLDGDRSPFVRIVVVRVASGRLREFVTIYREEVIPALGRVDGCRGVFLAESVGHPEDALSITLWEREEDAVRYDMSGEFERLTRRLAGTFSPLYDWGARLGEGVGASTPDVQSYQLIRGRRLADLGPPPIR